MTGSAGTNACCASPQGLTVRWFIKPANLGSQLENLNIHAAWHIHLSILPLALCAILTMLLTLLEVDKFQRYPITVQKLSLFPLISILIWFLNWFYAGKSHQQRRPRTALHTPKKYPHKDKAFGLDLLWKCTQSIKSHTFLRDNQSWVRDIYETFEYLVLGNKAVITLDPRNIKAILSTQFRDFGLGEPRMKGLEPLFADGIFNSEGDKWLHSKKSVRKYLTRHSDHQIAIFERSLQHLLKRIPTDGRSVDLQYLFSLLTLDTATEMFLGVSSNSLDSISIESEAVRFSQAFDYVQAYVSGIDDINIWTLLKNAFDKSQLRSNMALINAYIHGSIQEASSKSELSDPSAEPNMLQDLLRRGASHENIRTDILNVLLAAKDTTKTVLSNVWFLLARHPQVFNDLCIEITALNGVPPTAEQIGDMKLLQCVIKETLRLFPPVALNQRTANVDTTIPFGAGPDGLSPMFIKKGTSVGYNTYALHRRTDIFGADAEIFRPTRWLDDTLNPDWAFIPFHAGPRKCPGRKCYSGDVFWYDERKS